MIQAVGDWGTTRLRLFKLLDGAVTARAVGPGISVAGADLPGVLRGALRELGLERGDVLLCGMAGSRAGLIDSGYCPCPTGAAEWRAEASIITLDGFSVRIMRGVSGINWLGAPEVMRGEEAQVFGAMQLRLELATGSRILILPGTHSKWVEVRDGSIVRFHTFPTGEVFALLSQSSTLSAQIGPGKASDEAGGFAEGTERSVSAPGALSALFEARAAQLIAGRSGRWATAFLSGLLIGSEVREARALGLLDAPAPTLIGSPDLTELYARSMSRHGTSVDEMDGDRCALAGLGVLGKAGDIQ